jgi:hypothetical protein
MVMLDFCSKCECYLDCPQFYIFFYFLFIYCTIWKHHRLVCFMAEPLQNFWFCVLYILHPRYEKMNYILNTFRADAVIKIVSMAHWVKWANNKNKIYPTNIELYVNTCRCTMYTSIHVLSMKLIQQKIFLYIFH